MIVMLISILLGFLGLLYLWTRHKFSYFRSRGLKEDPAYFPLGSKGSWLIMTTKIPFSSLTNHVYLEYPDDKIVGTYGPLGQPILVVRNLELAKNVMIKDFDHFVDRRPVVASKKANKYFLDMLTSMTGERWKSMRNILSPVFTSGKLRSMMPIIHKVGDDLVDHLSDFCKSNDEFDAKDVLTSYTLDVISSAGLGVEANSLKDADSIIRHKIDILIGARNQDPYGIFRFLLIMLMPGLAKALDIAFINREATNFVIDIIRSSIDLRRKEKIRKNDLIDILIDALNDYKATEDKENDAADQFEKDAKVDSKAAKKTFTQQEIEDALISNALLLFFAGFDTSSSGMAIVTYFLAKNPHVQQQLFDEVEEAIAQNEGNQHLDYNVIQTLQYLDQVVMESLRLYPLTFVERQCVKDYKIPEMDFVIPKGMLVQIASPMIMRDRKYFENPDEFNPENFSPEKKAERSPYAFLSFGQGPRNCIGMRFALLQVKTAIVRMVANYKLVPCSRTIDKLDPDPLSRNFMPKGGVWIKVEKR